MQVQSAWRHPTVGCGLPIDNELEGHIKPYDVLMVRRIKDEPESNWLVLGRTVDQQEWETLAIYPTEQMASRMIQSILRSNPDAYYSP